VYDKSNLETCATFIFYLLLRNKHGSQTEISPHCGSAKLIKVIPVQAMEALYRYERLWLPHFQTFGSQMAQGCQTHATAAFTFRKLPGTHFS
jgi:hypothetical protein